MATPQRTESDPRFSRLAIIGAFGPLIFLAIGGLAAMVPIPIPAVAWWQPLLQLVVWLTAIVAALGTTIIGWTAVSQIRGSAGRRYGLGLAVFDGLIFPLLALDGMIFWAWNLIFQTLFPAFFNGSDIVNQTTGTTISLQSIALLLAVASSALVDFVIVWRTWRALTRPAKRPLSASPTDHPALAIIAISFYGMAGVLAILAWIRMPNPQQSVVWGILAAAVLAVLFAFPVRKTRLGKSALIGGSINVAVWLIIFIIFAVINGGHSNVPQPNTPSSVDFHYHVFEADSALVDRLIPKTQRAADPVGGDSTFKNGTGVATGGRGKGDFMVSTKGTTLTDAQVAIITPATLNELLNGIGNAPGLLVDNIFSVSSAFPWPVGMSDSWSYTRARDGFEGGGSGSAFLAYRQLDGHDQIHIDCSVDHDIDSLAPGNPTDLNSLLYYEGNVPHGGDIAFLIPFFRKDDSTHYLVVVYQVAAASAATDATTEPAVTATTVETETGPVIERTFEAGNPDRRGLNLATGDFAKSTPGNALNFDDDNTLRRAGVDVYYPQVSPESHDLRALDMRICEALTPNSPDNPNKIMDLDLIDNDQLRQQFDRIKHWQTAVENMRAAGMAPAATDHPQPNLTITGNNLYLITTRDGFEGVLQIVGYVDNPRGIKIRYKLVRPATSPATAP